ncbi:MULTISPECIES: preprotein translocase subunit SecG [unclassified Butyrivibrio]|uniref:preprotein translocase subunit SecG n=1 Tax=unclassified Butyrivibrio TaxID=2639466 RepID=UPI00040A9F69|nr:MULTISPECIES: preprotein translocase subunit SecG [unclassified Butyrivibrio]
MAALKIVLSIIFILDCVALVTLVLAQEGKTQGLGAIQGFAETTYWGKNKGRSREGILKKTTVVLSVLFVVLSVVLNMQVF